MAFFKNVDVVVENTSVDPIYESSVGLGVIKLDCIKFDNDCFKAAIKTDIREQMMITEGATGEELVSFQEVSISGMWEKVKAFFKKLWDKIKAFFRGWYARFAAWFTSNNKKFYDTYKKDVEQKIGELGDLEVKFRKRKGNIMDSVKQLGVNNEVVGDIKRLAKNIERDDNTYEAVVKDLTGGKDISSKSEIKDLMAEKFLMDEDTVKYLEIHNEVVEELKSADKAIKEIKQLENDINKTISNTIKGIEREIKSADDVKEFKTQPSAVASAIGRFVTDITSSATELLKTRAAACRKAFARAVAY